MKFYTSYLARAKTLDNDITPVYIFRYAPPSLNMLDTSHLPQLAPMAPVLRDYKTGAITMSTLKDTYLGYLNDNKDDFICLVNSAISKYEKICFICYEKDIESCHREVLAKFLEDNGFEYGGEI